MQKRNRSDSIRVQQDVLMKGIFEQVIGTMHQLFPSQRFDAVGFCSIPETKTSSLNFAGFSNLPYLNPALNISG